MAQYKLKEINDKALWEHFVLSCQPESFLQSWNWGEVNRRLGDKVFHLGFYKDSQLVGVCLVLKKTARRGDYLLVPAGPLLKNWQDKTLLDFLKKSLQDLARKENVWFVRLRPEIIDNEQNRQKFARRGWVKSPMHVHAENTWVLDLADKSEEDLLYDMRKNTRYSIRKSLKAGLGCQQTDDPASAEVLFQLQKETAARHNFVPFPKQLFQEEIAVFSKDGQVQHFTCTFNDEVIVAAIIIFYADCAYYHFSASSQKARQVPASYFLQWQIIKEAQKRGCRRYNFWGIAPEGEVEGHRFEGVTIFKTGFGGKRINWLPARDLPASPFYWVTHLFEYLRKNQRSL